MKRIAVLTSGGDAPGMNAAIRSVTRTALERGIAVVGVKGGYRGLMEGSFVNLDSRAVSGILDRGGTVLGSSRAPRFAGSEGQGDALNQLERAGIEGVVVIGGNGSQSGAYALAKHGVRVAGVASTIDNDLAGVDATLGVDTALNVIVKAADQLRTTAASHTRATLLEVMGRKCGYLALVSGIASGAELIVVPERPTTVDAVAEEIRDAYHRGKSHALIVVAEGHEGGAYGLRDGLAPFSEELGFPVRVTVLGYVQRGGVPTVADRMLGTLSAEAAVHGLVSGQEGRVWGRKNGRIIGVPLSEVAGITKGLEPEMLELAKVLAR